MRSWSRSTALTSVPEAPMTPMEAHVTGHVFVCHLTFCRSAASVCGFNSVAFPPEYSGSADNFQKRGSYDVSTLCQHSAGTRETYTSQHSATHYNTLQHTATHCNTPATLCQHSVGTRKTYTNQHSATLCNKLSTLCQHSVGIRET